MREERLGGSQPAPRAEPAVPAGGTSPLRHPRLRAGTGRGLWRTGGVALLRLTGGGAAPLRGVPLHAGRAAAGECGGHGVSSPGFCGAPPHCCPLPVPPRPTTRWWSWRRSRGWSRRWTRCGCGSSRPHGTTTASTPCSPPTLAPELHAHIQPPLGNKPLLGNKPQLGPSSAVLGAQRGKSPFFGAGTPSLTGTALGGPCRASGDGRGLPVPPSGPSLSTGWLWGVVGVPLPTCRGSPSPEIVLGGVTPPPTQTLTPCGIVLGAVVGAPLFPPGWSWGPAGRVGG